MIEVTFKWCKLNISKSGVIDAYIHWLILHMGLEDTRFVISLLFSYTKQRLWSFIGSNLRPHWRGCIVCLVKLGSVLVSWIPWSFWQGPMRFILIYTGIWALFGVVRSRTYDLWCWVELDKGVKSFNSSPSVQTILGLFGNLGSEVGGVFGARGHFVLLLVRGELNKGWGTLESPPNLVFPLCCLLPLSASLMSSWVWEGIRLCLCGSSVRTWLWCRGYFLEQFQFSIPDPWNSWICLWRYSWGLWASVFRSSRQWPFLWRRTFWVLRL